jgi:hypothetical protein
VWHFFNLPLTRVLSSDRLTDHHQPGFIDEARNEAEIKSHQGVYTYYKNRDGRREERSEEVYVVKSRGCGKHTVHGEEEEKR